MRAKHCSAIFAFLAILDLLYCLLFPPVLQEAALSAVRERLANLCCKGRTVMSGAKMLSSTLAFSLSSHRLSFISHVFSSRFLDS